jgi:hypothetical protein
MPDPADTQFLSEGLARYEQALETIAAFEAKMKERLQEVLKSYSCKSFEPTTAKLTRGAGGDADGKWIWAAQQGKLRYKGLVWLELGIWWRSGEVAYYCNFSDDNNKALDFTYKGQRTDIKFKLWSTKARLFMLTSKERYDSMNDDLKILMDELTNSF